MPRALCKMLVALQIMALSNVAQLAAAQPAVDADRERALALFRKGNEAFAAGDLERAYRAYKSAFELRRSFDIACNLARAEIELGKKTDAAAHLDYCLDNFSASTKTDLREAERKFRDLMQGLRAELAVLRVAVEPDGAALTIDGNVRGLTPIVDEIFLEPGEHVIVASRTGYASQQRVLIAEAGVMHRLTLELDSETSGDEPAVRPALNEPSDLSQPLPEPRSSARIALLGAGAALTAIGLGVGIGFASDARSAADRSERLRTQARTLGPEGCAADPSADFCRELADRLEQTQRSERIATIAFIGAAVSGGVALGAWLLWPTSPSETESLRFAASAGTSEGALWLSGRF